MRRLLALVLLAGLGGAPALGSTLNLSAKATGCPTCPTSTITVAPGATVNFVIEGILNDNLNEGLALVGFDLNFTGGDLAANTITPPTCPNPDAVLNCGTAMSAFVKDCGITNPAGYGGTLIGGDLIQVGGGLNSIKNSVSNPACTPNCAPFPIGNPPLGVAQPAAGGGCGTATIATGSLVAPMAPSPPGGYELQILNGFANTIKDGQILANVFLATEAATVAVTANLIIHVAADDCGIVSSNPANCLIDARYPHAPGNPAATLGFNSIAVTLNSSSCAAGAIPGDFAIACVPAGPPCPSITTVNTLDATVTVNLSTVIPARKWTCITHNDSGDQVCAGSLPADANSDRTAAPADILDIIDHLNGVRVPPLMTHQCDIDRSLLCQPPDILAEVDLLNGASGFENFNGATLLVCPSP